jgi:hypothetical protein
MGGLDWVMGLRVWKFGLNRVDVGGSGCRELDRWDPKPARIVIKNKNQSTTLVMLALVECIYVIFFFQKMHIYLGIILYYSFSNGSNQYISIYNTTFYYHNKIVPLHILETRTFSFLENQKLLLIFAFHLLL